MSGTWRYALCRSTGDAARHTIRYPDGRRDWTRRWRRGARLTGRASAVVHGDRARTCSRRGRRSTAYPASNCRRRAPRSARRAGGGSSGRSRCATARRDVHGAGGRRRAYWRMRRSAASISTIRFAATRSTPATAAWTATGLSGMTAASGWVELRHVTRDGGRSTVPVRPMIALRTWRSRRSTVACRRRRGRGFELGAVRLVIERTRRARRRSRDGTTGPGRARSRRPDPALAVTRRSARRSTAARSPATVSATRRVRERTRRRPFGTTVGRNATAVRDDRASAAGDRSTLGGGASPDVALRGPWRLAAWRRTRSTGSRGRRARWSMSTRRTRSRRGMTACRWARGGLRDGERLERDVHAADGGSPLCRLRAGDDEGVPGAAGVGGHAAADHGARRRRRSARRDDAEAAERGARGR